MDDNLRMLLADHGSPEALARCIAERFSGMTIPVPLLEIAEAVGITSVEAVHSTFEGVLVTDAAKTRGVISYNASSSVDRQRFTIAHEIGHFLIPTHDARAQCARTDMAIVKARDPVKAVEAQANEFASALLMPRAHFLADMRKLGAPETEHILQLHRRYQVSREAAARRYTTLSEHACAVVFSRNGVIRYSTRSEDCPFLLSKSDDPLPTESVSARSEIAVGTMSAWEEVDTEVWFDRSRRGATLYEQFLQQDNGYGLTMLSLEGDEADDDEDELVEDRWRPPGFSRR